MQMPAEAKKPEDWDEDEDGDWEPPKIANPKCEKGPGCGEWKRPNKPVRAQREMQGWWRGVGRAATRLSPNCCHLPTPPPAKQNPAYKGKWSAPMIDNPAYKGVWKPREIPNPDHVKDPAPLTNIGKVRFGISVG